jgi:cytoskeletal protein CcmA (bactofilin family)
MAILSKGTTYSDGDQVTSTNLNALVDSATFASDAVDDSTTQLSSGKIIVKDLGIATGKLAASAVTTAKIAGSNVTTAKIAAANITTSLIADSNVTKAKIENLADYKVLGNVSGGAAAPAEVAILDEDNMSSNSATSLATQQSIKAYVDTQLTAEDLDFAGDSGTGSVDLDGQTFTIAGSAGLDTSASSQTLTIALDFNEISNAAIADGDFIPFVDATDSTTKKEAIADIATLFAGTGLSASSSVLSVDASQTQITSVGTLGAGSISSGFGAIDNGSSAITTTGVGSFGSLDISGDVDVDGTLETDALSIASTAVTATAAELNYNDTGASVGTVVASKTVTVDSNKDVSSFRNITLTGELDAATLDISGDADIDGTLEADAITVDGTALATVIAGTTVTNATNSAHVLVTDNESTNEENLITFVEGATSSTGNVGLEMDGNFAYNPSTGTVSATIFKGNIDAVDGDFDGTLETDALSIGGTTVTSTAAELNYLDITTLGTSEASKAVTVDSNGDLLVPDSDKFKFGTGSDMQVYHDGTNSYIENSTGELKLATETSGIAIAIGHSTSEATFGDNVTITGNLTVNGTTTTVNTTNLTVTDPLVKFGEGYTGSAFDEGFIVTRGNGSASNTANKGFIWDESADEFAAIACNTEDGTTAGNVTINSYADLQVGKLTGGSLDISGDIDVDGTTNLDVVDIDGAVDMASTLTVAGDTVLNSDLEINVAGSSNSSKAIVINSSGTNFESDDGMIRLLHPSTGSGALTGGFFMKFNANSADKFTVKGNGDTTIAGNLFVGGTALAQADSLGVTPTGIIYSARASGSATHAIFYNGSSVVGSITTSTSATAFNTSSDYRLKENETNIIDGIDRLKQLSPYRFNFKVDPDETVDGFFAHEVSDIVPEAITGTKDGMKEEEYEVSPAVYEDVVHPAVEATYDEDGNELTPAVEGWTESVLVTEAVMDTRSVPDYQGIDQSKLVPLLTAALQEAVDKIEALEARVQTLEG